MQSKTVISPRLAISIDFGTYASSFGLQWGSDYQSNKKEIYCNKWGAERFLTYKTVTCILFGPDKSFQDFGHEAETRFSELGNDGDEGERRDDWYLFRHFKMALYQKKDVNETTMIEDVTGKALPIIEVITPAIKFMKDEALEYLEMSGLIYDETTTKWIITVPAIWEDNAKQVMRSCAEKAGIGGKYLSIALEPECAGLYCKEIPDDQLTLTLMNESGQKKYIGDPGCTFMVVDIGGGTVDITTLQVNEDGTIKQVCTSEGGPWGGTKVDERFYEMIRKAIGAKQWDDFITNNRDVELQLRRDFELAKRQVKPLGKKKKNFNVIIPTQLMEFLQSRKEKHIRELLKKGCNIFKIEKSRFAFPIEHITCLFDETIEGIMNHTNEVIRKIRSQDISIDSMIVVGGFAGSDYVINALRKELKKQDIPVIRPRDTELAVLKGAVLYGHNEKIITARVMRYTFGIGMVMEFDKKRNSPDKRFTDEKGIAWARDVFRKHVSVNEEVKTGIWVADKDYYPITDTQTLASVYVYSSTAADPDHTDDDSCKYVGKFDIHFPKDKAEIEVAMYFSGTEIYVRATEKKSGNVSYQTLKSF